MAEQPEQDNRPDSPDSQSSIITHAPIHTPKTQLTPVTYGLTLQYDPDTPQNTVLYGETSKLVSRPYQGAAPADITATTIDEDLIDVEEEEEEFDEYTQEDAEKDH